MEHIRFPDYGYSRIASSYIIERADEKFTCGPLTKNTFYHPSIYRPIVEPNEDDGIFVFAGYAYPYDDETHSAVTAFPSVICVDPDPALVETYLFSVRRYECLHTLQSQEYGGEYYKRVGNTGAAAEIRYAYFPDVPSYQRFIEKHYELSQLQLSHMKFKVDESLISFLPGHKKVRIPIVVESIIHEMQYNFIPQLTDTLYTLKYVMLLSNIENERLWDSKNPPKNSIIQALAATIEHLQDFKSFLTQSEEEYSGKTDAKLLKEIRKNIVRRAPILFNPEVEYQMEIRRKFEERHMELDYQRSMNDDYPFWERMEAAARYGDSLANQFLTTDR